MRWPWVLVVLLSTAPASALCQDTEAAQETRRPDLLDTVGLTGSVRAGYWSSTRNLDSAEHLAAGTLWVKAARDVSAGASYLVEGWAALRGPAGDVDGRGELREAFVSLRFGQFDVRAGRQIIAWGRADGVNPTDVLTPRDLTLLVPEEDDRRLGTTAVRASYYAGGVSITGVWLPEFQSHRIALPPPPPPVRLVVTEREWPGSQWAVRAEQTGRIVDWSASYFQGRDLVPDLAIDDTKAAAVVVRLAHRHVRMVGADVAANLGRMALRAEAAYIDTEHRGSDPFTKRPTFALVAGGDRTFHEHVNLNVQYLFRLVVDFDPVPSTGTELADRVATLQAVVSSQAARRQHGLSLRLAYKAFHETLEMECAAAGYSDPDGAVIRSKVIYGLSDHWKATVGAEIFRGATSSMFGLLRANSAGFMELRWSF